MSAPSRLQYEMQPWGEVIYGTREELQALGLGPAAEFPGESDWRTTLQVNDPRGFTCAISSADYMGGGIYVAVIRFPGRERPAASREGIAPGVTLARAVWYDEFVGSAAALAAAGLVRTGQLPGAPGMPKSTVNVAPDGSVVKIRARRDLPGGGRVISKRGRDRYSVAVHVAEDERARRGAAWWAAEADYLQRMAALPRPAPLVRLRAKLRLVGADR
jgi:hypothetical protein